MSFVLPRGARAFSSSVRVAANPRRARNMDDPLDLRSMGQFAFDDIPSHGHQVLARKRELLRYARIAESEMPKLKEFAKPYEPPRADAVLRVRSHHYQGEAHPSARKAVLTVRVADLLRTKALESEAAAHKFRLLAGPRYDAPTGAHEEGVLKISCERFPEEAQNLRWVAERVELLCKEANTNPAEFESVPLDERASLVRETKRSGFERRRAPTLQDFPKEWL